jgi:lipid A 3-O-deacylase
MRNVTRRLGVLCMMAAAVSTSAQDQVPAGSWTFQWENDLFAKDRNDRYYTNGLRFLYARPARLLAKENDARLLSRYTRMTGDWMCSWQSCEHGAAKAMAITHLGQNMYSPQDLTRSTFNPDDRPYAGWLYLGQRTQLFDLPDELFDASRMQTLDVLVGVVGPSAGAGKVQEEWHHLVNATDPKGWATQLRDEPGIVVMYTAMRRYSLTTLADALPYWRVSVGNVNTHAAVGGQVRFGRDLSGFGHFDPIAPSNVRNREAMDMKAAGERGAPSSARSDSPLYVFAAVEARVVARNIFIDGNTFRDYPRTSAISRRPLVGDFTLGFSAKLPRDFRVTYGHTWRSREFDNDRVPLPGTPRSQTQRYGVVQVQREL